MSYIKNRIRNWLFGDVPRQPQPTDRTIRKAARGPSRMKAYLDSADYAPARRQEPDPDDVLRRAVHAVNAEMGVQGLPRTDFSRADNDRLARNAAYALCEKATMDYFATADWEVRDGKGKRVESATRFLKWPSPDRTLNMTLKETVRDTLRYDAGAWVLSKRADGYLGEVKAYHGPDFWIEVDRDWSLLDGIGTQYYGPWSHGIVRRYWQHSRPGIYIPFEPEEVCYFMLYPRTDSVYGTDFIQRVKWPLEYLIDSTRAAGMTFANGVSPGAVWKHPSYSSVEQLAERELEIELQHLGPENFGGIIHLIGDESLEPFMPTLHDLEWLEGQRYVTEIVLAMFGFASSEFFQGDVNRATAYISRNITKSRMLYPLQVHFQNMITQKVLPLMEGWDDDWEFVFVDTVDLDDELKRAQINQTRASTATSYVMMGLSPEAALELAEVPDDLRTSVKEDLQTMLDQEAPWTSGLPDDPDDGAPHTEDYPGTAVDGDNAADREDGGKQFEPLKR